MSPISLMADNRTGGAPSAPPDAAKLKEIGGEFEALLIGEMLKHMRESGSGGWMGSGDDAAADTAVGYAEEALSKAMASQGGLGLSSMIVRGLQAAPATSPAASKTDSR